MSGDRHDPTPGQLRNRALVFVVLRLVSGLIAIGIAYNVVRGMIDGYLKIGVGESRGPGGDFVLLDTTFGRTVGSLLLEAAAVLFGLLAIAPRLALRPRFLLSTFAALVAATVLVNVLYR